MAIARKAVVFTIMAIIIVAFMLSSQRIARGSITDSEAQSDAAETRVTVMDEYLVTFESHAADVLATAGYFAFGNMSKKVSEDIIGGTGDFIVDINRTFETCVNDTNLIEYGGVNYTCLTQEQNVTRGILELTQLTRNYYGIQTTFQIHDYWVTEEDPMEVVLWMNISYTITDPVFASWDVPGQIIRTEIEVDGINDPVYEFLRASGYTAEVARPFDYQGTRYGFNRAKFDSYYQNRSYINVEGAGPSILQRYSGNTTGDSECCGVESVIDRGMLIAPPVAYQNYSMTDHHFTSHVRGTLPEFNCTGLLDLVKGYDVGGDTLILYWNNFDNIYNLTDFAEPDCAWP